MTLETGMAQGVGTGGRIDVSFSSTLVDFCFELQTHSLPSHRVSVVPAGEALVDLEETLGLVEPYRRLCIRALELALFALKKRT